MNCITCNKQMTPTDRIENEEIMVLTESCPQCKITIVSLKSKLQYTIDMVQIK